MDELILASEIFGISNSNLKVFEEKDLYNGNTVKGVMCTKPNQFYGSLLITEVNSKETEPQLIRCTPKLHYPFDDERKFRWPKNILFYQRYAKLDGTNICHFQYKDSDGNAYRSFKTRLTPFLRRSESYDFYSMWNNLKISEILMEEDYTENGDYALSFELYGYMNPILIKYDVALEAKLLFNIVQKTGDIVHIGKSYSGPELTQWRLAPIEAEGDLIVPIDHEKLTNTYENVREKLELTLQPDEDTGMIKGMEGYIFYVVTDDEQYMFKCKPPTIERIHMTSCGSIDKNSIFVTCRNALENNKWSDITKEIIIEMLQEEYPDELIAKSSTRIDNILSEFIENMMFRDKVKEIYEDTDGYHDDKRTTMRAMSAFFEKKDMKKVYTVLKELGRVE